MRERKRLAQVYGEGNLSTPKKLFLEHTPGKGHRLVRTKAPVGHAKKERREVVCHRVGSHAMGSE